MSYRVSDFPQGLEASPYRKHVINGVRNSCKLEKHADTEKIGFAFFFNAFLTSATSFCESHLGLVEFFDPHTVNDGSHSPGPLSLQNKMNKPKFSDL